MRSFVVGATVIAVALLVRDADADLLVRGKPSLVDKPKLEGLLRLELGTAGDVEDVVVDLSDREAAIVLKRHDGSSRRGTIALPSSGNGEIERTIALFIGEISREQDVALASATPEAPAPPAPAPPALAAAAPTAAAPATPEAPADGRGSHLGRSLFLGVETCVFTSGGAFFIGPNAGVDLYARERFSVGVSGRYIVASTDVALGTVSAQILSGRVSAAYVLLRSESLALQSGVGVDAGWIGGSGRGPNERSTSGLGVAPTAFFAGRLALPKRTRLVATIEGGWLGPGLDLRAGDSTALAVSGIFVGGRLDVGVAF